MRARTALHPPRGRPFRRLALALSLLLPFLAPFHVAPCHCTAEHNCGCTCWAGGAARAAAPSCCAGHGTPASTAASARACGGGTADEEGGPAAAHRTLVRSEVLRPPPGPEPAPSARLRLRLPVPRRTAGTWSEAPPVPPPEA